MTIGVPIVTCLPRLYQQCSSSVPIVKNSQKTVKTAKMTTGVPIVTCLHRVCRIHKVRICRLPQNLTEELFRGLQMPVIPEISRKKLIRGIPRSPQITDAPTKGERKALGRYHFVFSWKFKLKFRTWFISTFVVSQQGRKKVSILFITTSYNSTVHLIDESCSKFLTFTGNVRWRRHSADGGLTHSQLS